MYVLQACERTSYSTHAKGKKGRKERGKLPSRSPFNVDFKSQIATHERESCVLKHERHAREGERGRERKRERGNNIYALGTERRRQRPMYREWLKSIS